jgi:hypothetical protein
VKLPNADAAGDAEKQKRNPIMFSMIRSGWIAALYLCVVSSSAFAQDRLSNTIKSSRVLNAESLAFVSATEGGVEHLADPGFEAGTPNPFWTESSTNFGTPLCTIATCGTGLGTGPNSGLWWAWFGGISFLDEEASVSQAVTFPSSAATLSFHIEAPVCQGSPADYIEVLVDGNQEWVLFGDDPLCGFIG